MFSPLPSSTNVSRTGFSFLSAKSCDTSVPHYILLSVCCWVFRYCQSGGHSSSPEQTFWLEYTGVPIDTAPILFISACGSISSLHFFYIYAFKICDNISFNETNLFTVRHIWKCTLFFTSVVPQAYKSLRVNESYFTSQQYITVCKSGYFRKISCDQ